MRTESNEKTNQTSPWDMTNAFANKTADCSIAISKHSWFRMNNKTNSHTSDQLLMMLDFMHSLREAESTDCIFSPLGKGGALDEFALPGMVGTEGPDAGTGATCIGATLEFAELGKCAADIAGAIIDCGCCSPEVLAGGGGVGVAALAFEILFLIIDSLFLNSTSGPTLTPFGNISLGFCSANFGGIGAVSLAGGSISIGSGSVLLLDS
uniref:Uncharacterized protein n=1 Tax=Glossina pallidipes TaxID=7398 RepID=A0A1A9Z9S0_GLOPL